MAFLLSSILSILFPSRLLFSLLSTCYLSSTHHFTPFYTSLIHTSVSQSQFHSFPTSPLQYIKLILYSVALSRLYWLKSAEVPCLCMGLEVASMKVSYSHTNTSYTHTHINTHSHTHTHVPTGIHLLHVVD